MKTLLTALTIALASLSAHADKLQLSFDVTQHIGSKQKYHDVHFMAEYQTGDYSVGVYNNSIGKVSLYAGKRFNMGGGYTLGLGIVTGYDVPVAPAMQVTKALDKSTDLFLFPTVEFNKGTNGARIVPVIGVRFKL